MSMSVLEGLELFCSVHEECFVCGNLLGVGERREQTEDGLICLRCFPGRYLMKLRDLRVAEIKQSIPHDNHDDGGLNPPGKRAA